MRTRSSLDLVALLAITGIAIVGLHQLGEVPGLSIDWSDPVRWAEGSRPEDVVGGVLRQVGLAIGYWVLATTAVYAAAGSRGRHSRWVRFITVPIIRRAVDRALAASLAATILATPVGPALAADPPPPVVYEASSDGIPVPHVQYGDTSGIEEEQPQPDFEQLPNRVVMPITVPLAAATGEPNEEKQHAVVSGENLWIIAEAYLAESRGETPEGAAVADYWRLVVDVNRDAIRSGDPNLIYPGEIITLPALP